MKMGNHAKPTSRWSKYNRKACEVCGKQLYRGSISGRCHAHHIFTEQAKRNIGLALRGGRNGMKRKEVAMKLTGANHYNWKGGITTVNTKIRSSVEYREWRIAVFRRDKYTCQSCGVKGGTLHADHIKPFAYFVELRFELSNGQTLCVGCHRKTLTFGGRVKQYAK